ncbi:crotonase/enoyl-CoA hydratase family protein [Bradyrhizobium sp. ISRA443]|uniref:crotonase/enoyl-CoA hydratase family protein n=1 Tax=unclassified Bradyrhizobium TaxID=2631580 RepID=UPI0024790AAD|nr:MULTISPECIES: crotonase/enoyl-CoA hydratase family protein [unclassified Bradyrhizobium]WGR99512.1 crotonase/enoyl-CoA hydratase family protein [Bradyrhizobium sp. ISRA436]WGS06402.1 crotonase/enoyl-CoA hydratase family protein [Bradyrhizobium sp. ISRA437]WGS13286.1 crotonase/enoyl-CoA hydratase family protein [Bradyrhizobium sp. ISRA443]
MDDRVHLSIANGIADVRLNRPDKLNALDPAMFSAIAAAGARLKDDRSVRAVVLSGEGKAFCAGLDMERLVATAEGESILPFADLGQRTHGIANWAQHLVWLWRELPVPVIAAVHGIAFGGGFQLTLGADIRYLAPDTRLAIVEAKWGLVPDMAGTQLMRHLASEDVVRELTYTARIFSAQEALAYGLATRIMDDPREAALATARMIADRSPDAIRAAKRLLNLAVGCDAATGLAAETAAQATLLGQANHVEAVRANLEDRTPQWSFA